MLCCEERSVFSRTPRTVAFKLHRSSGLSSVTVCKQWAGNKEDTVLIYFISKCLTRLVFIDFTKTITNCGWPQHACAIKKNIKCKKKKKHPTCRYGQLYILWVSFQTFGNQIQQIGLVEHRECLAAALTEQTAQYDRETLSSDSSVDLKVLKSETTGHFTH